MMSYTVQPSNLPENRLYCSEMDAHFDRYVRQVWLQQRDDVTKLADPYSCPRAMLPYWVFEAGVGRLWSQVIDEQYERDIAYWAGEIAFRQGTDWSLQKFSEITGSSYSYTRRAAASGRTLGWHIEIIPEPEADIAEREFLAAAYKSLLPFGWNTASVITAGVAIERIMVGVIAPLGHVQMRRKA